MVHTCMFTYTHNCFLKINYYDAFSVFLTFFNGAITAATLPDFRLFCYLGSWMFFRVI